MFEEHNDHTAAATPAQEGDARRPSPQTRKRRTLDPEQARRISRIYWDAQSDEQRRAHTLPARTGRTRAALTALVGELTARLLGEIGGEE